MIHMLKVVKTSETVMVVNRSNMTFLYQTAKLDTFTFFCRYDETYDVIYEVIQAKFMASLALEPYYMHGP